MGNRLGVENFIRLSIFGAVAVGILVDRGNDRMPMFILLLLVFLLNVQLRVVLFRRKLFLASLIADAGLVHFLYGSYGSLTCLLLLISVIDAQGLGREESIPLSLLFLGLFGYWLRQESVRIIVYHVLLFIAAAVFAGYITGLRKRLSEMELLYDENRRYSYQLEDARKRLVDYSKKVEQLTLLEERNRISREIHDTIGHRLTGILMQVEATIRVMKSNPDQGMELLDAVRDNLNQGVETLRQTVRGMKPAEYAGRLLSIRQLLLDFEKSTGTGIDFSVSGNPIKLMPSTEITLYRNVQEAVTNAVRHGKAKQIWVGIDYRENEVALSVRDDGVGCNEVTKGMGISGMEERVELLGGRLEISSGQGFEVRTFIPVR